MKKLFKVLNIVQHVIDLARFIFNKPGKQDPEKQNEKVMGKSFLNMPGYPLGLRNNNPGNLADVGIDWQGRIGSNQGFVVFEDISWGIRALGMDLTNDIREGTNTIRKLITEFAPPSENNTSAYISSVVSFTGISADQVIQADGETLRRIIRAIMNVELGVNYSNMVTDADINEGLSKMPGGSGLLGPAGFTVATALFLFVLGVLATMPRIKG